MTLGAAKRVGMGQKLFDWRESVASGPGNGGKTASLTISP